MLEAAARDAVLDLLRIRASSSLFRLRTAEDVARRLTSPAAGANLIAGHLDGAGLSGANFREVLYVINADPAPQTVNIDALKGKPFVLHPAHARMAASANAASGAFSVPARTAAVFVID
jgi:pullulanase